MFEQYGPVTDCFLPTDRDTGRVRGFAFVTMPAKEAEQACAKVNGLELDGRTLRVNEAQPKGMGGGGRGGGRGGYGGDGGYGGALDLFIVVPTELGSVRILFSHDCCSYT